MADNQFSDQDMDNKSNSVQKSTLFGFHKHDGTLTITFDEEKIEAWGDFIPPIAHGKPLTSEYVADALQKFNIKHGVIWENIEEALNLLKESGKSVKNILIARGERAIPEIPSRFELDSALKSPGFPSLDIPQVDYKTISPFIMVKKDQILARLKETVEGTDGKTIHGEIIPKSVLNKQGVSGEKNTRTEDDKIISTIDGRLINANGVLSVDEVLLIKGNVGYATGHISFPGDIIIEGFVAEGFKIVSGGSILVKETLDATEVIAKKDLIVSGGIIGHGKAFLKVGGSVKAKFLRNCRLAARNEVIIDSEIVNSSVFTLKQLLMSDKGSIIGGEIYAVHGVKTAFIGKDSGKSTQIHCGIDFTVQQEMEKLNYQLRIINGKQEKLKTIIESSFGAALADQKIEELSARLKDEFLKVQNRIIELMPKLNADENAVVEVKGEMSLGTLIDICDVALLVEKNTKKAKVSLSKEKGALIIASL
jgi:uncharacterized protein (DUF342 family)